TPPTPPLFPYTTLFRSAEGHRVPRLRPTRGPVARAARRRGRGGPSLREPAPGATGHREWSLGDAREARGRGSRRVPPADRPGPRSEEHTSELQSRGHLV